MAYKFFNIGKANAEIERLEAALTAANEKVTALEANEPEALAAAQGELTKAQTDLTQARSDLATAKQSIASLTSEKETLTAQAAKLTADLEAKGQSLETEASRKALEITAAQGQPPVETKPASGFGATEKAVSNLSGLELAIAAHTAKKLSQTK